MRSYTVKENHISSAPTDRKRDRQTDYKIDRKTDRYKEIYIIRNRVNWVLYEYISFFMAIIGEIIGQPKLFSTIVQHLL